MCKRIIILYIILFSPLWGIAYSQGQKIAKVDSLTLAYYNRCLKKIADPIVLSMADTLYRMAQNDSDKRMQAVALCTKLDYYYYNKDEEHQYDSIVTWTQRVQHFAKATAQPKYYFFVWGFRLINYHLIRKEYNIALAEAQKMLKEAQAEDYKEGIADCYSVLYNIYTAKGLYEQAFEAGLAEIEFFENHNLERYNIALRYTSVGTYLSDEGKFEEAETYFEKAEKQVHSPYHRVHVMLHRVRNYILSNQLNQAHKILTETQQIFASDESLSFHKEILHRSEVSYFMATKEYFKALQALELWEEAVKLRQMKASLSELYQTKADIYWQMNKKAEAAGVYRQLIEITKAEKAQNEEIATAEIATLLNIQKLNDENKKLEELTKEKQLHHNWSIIILLSILLLIVISFLYHQHRLNVRLKKSRDKLDEKNRTLLQAEEELRQAKEVAEQNSRMKDIFIQNISHEIRTPLNSIVGFSTILSEICQSQDVRVYADTIEKNSQLLLQMINDIIELSDLDRGSNKLNVNPVDINQCASLAVEETLPYLAEGVELSYSPLDGNPLVNTDKQLIMQVLRNLLNNAAKFTQSGNITLVIKRDDEKNEYQFIITDTGIGIPKDKREKVFDRFTKLDEFSQGTGLGLSICRLSAEKLGGSLIIDEEYTAGTRFIFGIPQK